MSSVIQRLLATEVVEVHKEACKNYRNKTVACSLCVDCCSEEAISLENKIPVIFDTKCIDCGACVSECPVNAIDHLSKPYKKIANYVNNYPLADITCDKVEEFNRGIKVPCLLYLDAPLLSQYADKREILNIYTGHCHSCKKVEADKVFKHFRKLERQLEALGITIEIITKQKLPKNSSQQIVNAVSRREILSRFSISNIREFILPTNKTNEIKIETDSSKNYESLSITERIHFKKKLLNNLYVNEDSSNINKNEQISPKHSPSFNVTNTCNGCTVCERICPTKAIYWETYEDTARLIFDSQLCVDCDKCLACPVGALTKSEQTQLDTDFIKELISMNVVRCLDCGETFKTVQKDEVTCFFCKEKKSKDSKRFFTT